MTSARSLLDAYKQTDGQSVLFCTIYASNYLWVVVIFAGTGVNVADVIEIIGLFFAENYI